MSYTIEITTIQKTISQNFIEIKGIQSKVFLLKHTAKKLEKKGIEKRENGVREKKPPPYLATRGDTSAHTRPHGHPNTNWVTQITPITLFIQVF